MQTIVLHFCYFVLILLFSTAYNTSLIYCFVIWCLHTNREDPAPLRSRAIRRLVLVQNSLWVCFTFIVLLPLSLNLIWISSAISLNCMLLFSCIGGLNAHQCCLWQLVVFCSGLLAPFCFCVFFFLRGMICKSGWGICISSFRLCVLVVGFLRCVAAQVSIFVQLWLGKPGPMFCRFYSFCQLSTEPLSFIGPYSEEKKGTDMHM